MNLFRNAVIPSTSRPKSPPPPPPRSGNYHYHFLKKKKKFFFLGRLRFDSDKHFSLGGGRPPPDYGPYQGPNTGRGRRY